MFSVVVLAAGFSSRMKQNKATLKFIHDKTFIEQIVEQFLTHSLCNKIIVVINRKSIQISQSFPLKNEKVVFTINNFPEKGRFYSIQCGLNKLKEYEHVFVHNVDNPFVNHKTINLLIQGINNSDYAVPQYQNKGGHPVLLSKKIANDIAKEKDTDHNFREYLKKYTKKAIPVNDKHILVNINTFEEYKKHFPDSL